MTAFDSSSCGEAAIDIVVEEGTDFYDTLFNLKTFSKHRHHLFKLSYSLVSELKRSFLILWLSNSTQGKSM